MCQNKKWSGLVLCLTLLCNQALAIETNENASIKDATSTVMGVNHIGLSVKDLDKVLNFYQQATDFKLLKRETVSNSLAADKLYGVNNITFERAVLQAPNMLFELVEFTHNHDAQISDMPVQGPGMTHTCFQSAESDSGFPRFMDSGARLLTRGNQPIDIGGYGVTYAYGYDPEGNMFELEQLDGKLLDKSGYDKSWQEQGERMWMSQVALVTHDIESLMHFYQNVLGFKPYRTGQYSNNEKLDAITNVDGVALKAGWFRMNDKTKVMEFWQYLHPITQQNTKTRQNTDLGYTFSLEVKDIHWEYKRLKDLGVKFISAPQRLGEFWHVIAQDSDGNFFTLRQAIDPKSEWSLAIFEQLR